MADLTINRLGEEAQRDNEQQPMSSIRQYDKPLSTRRSPAETRTNIIFGGLAALVLLGTLALIGLASCWGVSEFSPSFGCTLSTSLFWLYVIAAPMSVVAWIILTLFWAHQKTQAEVARAMITRDRFDNPVSAALVLGKPLDQMWNELVLATQADVATAPFRQLPVGLDSLSVNQSNSATNSAGKTEPVASLPAPTVDVGPLPSEKWLEWLDSQPHPMLAAETGGGKSTLAKAILARRIDNDEDVLVIDPHSSEWFELPGVGGGEDWMVVQRAMGAVVDEYRSRLAERERVKEETGRELPKTHFKRLTVLFDEANNAKLHFDTTSPNKRVNPWYTFIQALGSGARKVNISILMLVQSANVEDLGISGAMRENFAVVALDSRCILYQIDQNEKRKDRRDALYAAVGGREWPATTVINGEVYLLDRSNIRDVTPRRDSTRAAWQGWNYQDDVSVRPSENEKAENSALDRYADGRTRTDGKIVVTDADKLALLRAMRDGGRTREEARDRFSRMGLGFENADWTEAGK